MSDSEDDLDIENYLPPNVKKVYQLQHDKDDLFKFTFMGMFETLPLVKLGDFNHNDLFCYLTSHFVFEDIVNKNNIDMITLNITKDDRIMELIIGIEFKDSIDLEELNKGEVYIKFVDKEKNIDEIIKKNLIFPGSTKILYFLVAELKNDKVSAYING